MYNNIAYHYSRHEPLVPSYMSEKVIKLKDGRQLFVDDYLIDELTNCEKKYYSAEKNVKNPVLIPDLNECNFSAPNMDSVIWDPYSKHFKMWYSMEEAPIKWSVIISGNENLEEINQSFNAPKEFKELSEVSDQIRVFNEKLLSPENIMSLAMKCDLIRKPERFFRAVKASSYFGKSLLENNDEWKIIFDLISSIKIDQSIKDGKLIAKKLYEDRLIALKNYLTIYDN